MSVRTGILAIGLLGGGAAFAADDAPLAKCAAMADAAARLACYDAVAGRPPDGGAEANFGLTSRPAPALQMPDKLEAHLAGSVKEFSRGMVLKLDNGQSWKLIGDDNAYYQDLPDNAEVVITKGFLGTYWLEIGAINRRFKVRRLE